MPKKKTHEEFVKEVYDLVGDEYTIVGRYVNSQTPVLMIHNLCGKEYSPKPALFLGTKNRNGRRCCHCYGNNRKTTDQYRQEVFELVGDEYTVLGEYKQNKIKIEMFHKNCGEHFSMSPNQFLRGTRCPICNGTPNKGHDHFIKEVEELGQGEYEVIGLYKTANTKLELKHKICGGTYPVKPSTFRNGHRCPYCSNNKVLRGRNDLVTKRPDLINQWHPTKNEGLKPTEVSEFSGKKVWWLGECGHEWEATIAQRSNQGCPYCAGRRVLVGFNDLAFKNPKLASEWHPVKNNGLKPTEVTEGSDKNVWWLCSICSCEWESTVGNRNRGNGCPRCNQSKGERYIQECLKRHNINFKPQHRYSDCRNTNPLPFDVAALDEAGNVSCLIEFDGEGHFYPIEHHGGEEGFKERQINDNIKNQYCENNNIILIRIPYWLRDYVDEVLTHWLEYYHII